MTQISNCLACGSEAIVNTDTEAAATSYVKCTGCGSATAKFETRKAAVAMWNSAFGEKIPSTKQVGGNHYVKLKIQPMQYALENNLNGAQANAIKYITRYQDKNGIEDLRKAIHCIELLIEWESNK